MCENEMRNDENTITVTVAVLALGFGSVSVRRNVITLIKVGSRTCGIENFYLENALSVLCHRM